MVVGYKGRRKERPKELVQTVGIPLAGFAGNAGMEWVARCSPPPPLPKGISPRAVAQGGCFRGRCGWLGRAAQLPAPSAHRGRPLLWGGPSLLPALHPSNRRAGSTWRYTAHTIQTDACPLGQRLQRHGLSVCWTAMAPRLPPAASQEPVPHNTVTAGSGSIASSSRVPWGPGSQCRGEPSQARWALTSTGGATHPPAARPQGNECSARGRAGGTSSRRAACRSQPRLEGAEALTCQPA